MDIGSSIGMDAEESREAVVVGLDIQTVDGPVLEWAVQDAHRRHRRLHLVAAEELSYPESVDAPLALPGHVDTDELGRRAEHRARALAPDLSTSVVRVPGTLTPYLLGASAVADSIVVSGRGTGWFHSLLLGSTAHQVAARAGCPVVVVHDDALPGSGGVVVGVDGSPTSARAVGYAFMQADARHTGLTVVHAWRGDPLGESLGWGAWGEWWDMQAEPEQVLTSESLAGWRDQYPDVPVVTTVVEDDPVRAIVAAAATSALVVVGSRGRGDVRGSLLGSVGHEVIRHVRIPVAVVRPHPTEEDLTEAADRDRLARSVPTASGTLGP